METIYLSECQKKSKLHLSNYLTWRSFSECFNEATWNLILSTKDIEISLEGYNAILPEGIIWIYFILLYRRTNRFHTFITLPNNSKQLAYLKYIGFERYQYILDTHFTNDYLWELNRFEYKPKDVNLQNLKETRLVYGNNWHNVLNQLTPYLTKHMSERFNIIPNTNYDDQKIKPFLKTMVELSQNIVFHGGEREGNGQGFISFTPPAKKENSLRLCVNDIGDGFRATLSRKNIQTNNEVEAIYRGLLLRFEKSNEGIIGLYKTLSFIREREGVIGIRSGNAFVKIDLSTKKNQKIFDEEYHSPSMFWLKKISREEIFFDIPGTHIFVELK